jgi:hypothetical protein
MISLENQMYSLELFKRLKELGVKQESYFYWKQDENEPYLVAHSSRYMTSKGEILTFRRILRYGGSWLSEILRRSGFGG